MKRVVFLYTELADYTLFALEELSKSTKVFIVHYPINPDAPFQFNIPKNITCLSRSGLTHSKLSAWVFNIKPHLLICSGWSDGLYLQTVMAWNKPERSILCMDTLWNNRPRQWLACIISRWTLTRWFKTAWVPGGLQNRYAQKLGFKSIFTGFYCCRHSLYLPVFEERKKTALAPTKVLLFIGRYHAQKNVIALWKSFMELSENEGSDWELWCVGTGPETPVKHSKIKHFGFLQPQETIKLISQSHAFILPSQFEPWGVVVHEMACAGLPLILSNAVGCAEQFLIPEKNGFIFDSKSEQSLKDVLKKLFETSAEIRTAMGVASHEQSKSITVTQWVQTLQNWLSEVPA